MKRAWLAILILASGTAVFCSLHHATVETKQELVAQITAWQTQTQQVALLQLERQQVLTRLSDTRQLLSTQPSLPALTQLQEKILSGAPLQDLSAAEAEQLRAELGFSWYTTGDYLIISKKSLEGISFDALKGTKLTGASLAALAITPAEQAAIEIVTRQLVDTRAAWAKEHVERSEPAGKVLAKYSLPEDPAFARSQLEIFTNGITGVLGDQRGHWLQEHSAGWMMDFGLSLKPDDSKLPAEVRATLPASYFESQPTTLTVEREKDGEGSRLYYAVQRARGSMSSSVTPWQPFPEAFRAVFPGGWKELAEREGFELPKEFQKKN